MASIRLSFSKSRVRTRRPSRPCNRPTPPLASRSGI